MQHTGENARLNLHAYSVNVELEIIRVKLKENIQPSDYSEIELAFETNSKLYVANCRKKERVGKPH